MCFATLQVVKGCDRFKNKGLQHEDKLSKMFEDLGIQVMSIGLLQVVYHLPQQRITLPFNIDGEEETQDKY
jgi:hypothetical protein